jgi:hypothetical protein
VKKFARLVKIPISVSLLQSSLTFVRWNNSSVAGFDRLVLVVRSSGRIIKDILWDQSFILFGNSKLCAFYYRAIVLFENIKGIIQPDLFTNQTTAFLLELVEKVIYSDLRRPTLQTLFKRFLCEVFVFQIVKFQYIIKSAAWQ